MSNIVLNRAPDRPVWRLVTWSDLYGDNPELVYKRFIEHKVIALGWSFIGSLTNIHPFSSDAIANLIRPSGLRNAAAGGRSLYCFDKELCPGHLVILSTRGRRWKVVAVSGPYEYQIDNRLTQEDLYHRRAIEETNLDPDELWQQCGGLPSNTHVYDTLIRLR